MHIKVKDASEVCTILEGQLKISNYKVISNEVIRIYDDIESEKVSMALAENNIGVKECMPVDESLEDYFTKLIGEAN